MFAVPVPVFASVSVRLFCQSFRIEPNDNEVGLTETTGKAPVPLIVSVLLV